MTLALANLTETIDPEVLVQTDLNFEHADSKITEKPHVWRFPDGSTQKPHQRRPFRA